MAKKLGKAFRAPHAGKKVKPSPHKVMPSGHRSKSVTMGHRAMPGHKP